LSTGVCEIVKAMKPDVPNITFKQQQKKYNIFVRQLRTKKCRH